MKTCKDCKHKYALKYDSGKSFYYCRIQISNKTANGLLKIKLKNQACEHFNSEVFKPLI